MSATVVELVVPAVNDDVVYLLERALREAKAGGIASIAIAIVTHDQQIGHSSVVGGRFASLLSSVSCMQHDIIADQGR